MRIRAMPEDVEFVFVAVEELGGGMLIDFVGDEVESGGREGVVVIEQGDVFTAR